MTVCADKLALRDLFKDRAPIMALKEGADVGELVRSRKVIPGHGGVVKEFPQSAHGVCSKSVGRFPVDGTPSAAS
jgi:hypothetical protein